MSLLSRREFLPTILHAIGAASAAVAALGRRSEPAKEPARLKNSGHILRPPTDLVSQWRRHYTQETVAPDQIGFSTILRFTIDSEFFLTAKGRRKLKEFPGFLDGYAIQWAPGTIKKIDVQIIDNGSIVRFKVVGTVN
jgi:hypothetical protein